MRSKDGEIMADEARVAYERAVDLYGQGKAQEATGALLALIEKIPDFYDAYETLGMILYKQGRLDEAITWTQKLATLRPDYPMAHTNLSVFYMKKGMKEKAEEEKAQAMVINIQNAGKIKK